jgi:hypothetical protein
MIEVNIRGAFQTIGFTHNINQTPYGLLFDEEKLRQSPGFVELWDRDTPLESLSKRRRAAKFGWINKPEQIDLIHISCLFDARKQRYATNHLIQKWGFRCPGRLACTYSVFLSRLALILSHCWLFFILLHGSREK